jgi:aspartyl-tRNA(Asn)/glutamyl-tRNA(Gln) amidotransferase subunit A
MALSIAEAGRQLRAGAVTSVALTQQTLDAVAAAQPTLHAFITITAERALADASRADAAFAAGQDAGPLQGVPYGLKDIYDTAGIRTTCHSKLRQDIVPDADCAVAAKLAAAGGVLIGKLATHEFAIGGPSFDLPWPPARNPWNTEHFTGGSSSGSGAAVAAGLLCMAMGSDTGGSIRGPAAYCGTVGIKPTYGLVSRRGVFPLSYTLDHCGPLSRTVLDSAITLQLIAGYDPLDPASADLPVPDYTAGLEDGVSGLRIGVPRAFFASAAATTPDMLAAFDQAVRGLRDAGARVEDVSLPDYVLFNACGRTILTAEAYAIHEQDLQSRLQDYGAITVSRLALGATLNAADLTQAFRLRRELTDAVNAAFGRYDALITASALSTAPRFDSIVDPNIARLAPMQTIPFNVTGHPAMSVPTGRGDGGLPLSLQVVGRPFDEAMVLRVGRAIERMTGWDGAVGVPPGY